MTTEPSAGPDDRLLEFPTLVEPKLAEDVEQLREQNTSLRHRLKTTMEQVNGFIAAARAYRGERELYRTICNHMVSLGGHRSLDAFLDGAIRAIEKMSIAERAAIILFDPGGSQAPTMLRAVNFADGGKPLLGNQVSKEIITRVQSSGRKFYAKNALEEPNLKGSRSVLQQEVRTVLCVPVPEPGTNRTVGVIYLDNRERPDAFPVESQQAIELFGRYLGLWVEQHNRAEAQSRSDDPTHPYRKAGRFREILGRSAALAEVLREMDRIVTKDIFANTLITGETGTGKDLVARCLHRYSTRVSRPFVAINCAAIPENLIESELFGSEAGAFTGARSRAGLMEEATGGVCFLDEIGELSLNVQAKLLRALQDQRIRRVGGSREVPIDVWVIAATNRNLETEVAQKRFRSDLYFRLNVNRIEIPPLRARPEDVIEMARGFLQVEVAKPYVNARLFSVEALEAIRAGSWPGNARELEHLIQKAASRANGPYVSVEDLDLDGKRGSTPRAERDTAWKRVTLDFQRRYLEFAMSEWGPSVTDVARRLDVHRTYLYKLLDSHDLPVPRERR